MDIMIKQLLYQLIRKNIKTMENTTKKEGHVVVNDWFHILHEIHEEECTCSYCKGSNTKLHYGLNIPKSYNKANSWWVIKYNKRHYIRWTNTWLLKLR
jgi:hypothetical protein